MIFTLLTEFQTRQNLKITLLNLFTCNHNGVDYWLHKTTMGSSVMFSFSNIAAGRLSYQILPNPRLYPSFTKFLIVRQTWFLPAPSDLPGNWCSGNISCNNFGNVAITSCSIVPLKSSIGMTHFGKNCIRRPVRDPSFCLFGMEQCWRRPG